MQGKWKRKMLVVLCSIAALLLLNVSEISAEEPQKQTETEIPVEPETVIVKNPVIKLSAVDYTYNGKVQTPKVTVTDKSGKRYSSKDYKLTYSSGRKNVGKYKVKVTFRGMYKGTFTTTFQIRPKKTTLHKTYLNGNSLVVYWKKQSSQITGYQVQYALDQRFKKGVKNSYVKNNSDVFQVIRNVKSSKSYVRIRTYKQTRFDGKTFNLYSDWSPVKSAVKKKVVALTYDDGPGKKTGKLLRRLEKYDAHATFFVVGNKVSSYKSEIKKMKNIGCEVGNHSYSHPNLGSASMSKVTSEVNKTNSRIKAITKENVSLMRPPYGSIGSSLKKGAKMPLILWSIDTRDWQTRSASKTISAATGKIKDGDIILMHDIHNSTIEASMKIIPQLKKKGYEMVTVSEMAKIKGKKLRSGSRYASMKN